MKEHSKEQKRMCHTHQDALIHRQRTCDGDFPNFLWPISYLEYIRDIFVLGLKTQSFCMKNNLIHLSVDKGLIVSKWVLVVWPIIPQMPRNFSAQFVCLSSKVWDIIENRLHRASVVRAFIHSFALYYTSSWKQEPYIDRP